MEIALVPIMILNLGGGIAGGIWFAVLGNWLAIAVGIGIAIFGNWLISFALMPAMLLFGAPGAALQERGKNTAAIFLGLLNAVYVSALITVWCVGTLYLLDALSATHSVVPLALFSYGSGTASWAYLAQKDRDRGGNEFTTISVLFAEVAFVVVGIVLIFGASQFSTLILIFSAFMAVSVITQMIFAVHLSRRRYSL